jgi:hypothetical protein
MNKQMIYEMLESKQLTFTDYDTVRVKDNGERMVAISSSGGL